MNESVILGNPLLLVLYGLALAISVYDKWKPTGIILPVLSALIVVGTSAYAILLGASLFETAAAVMVFLFVQLIGLGRDEK